MRQVKKRTNRRVRIIRNLLLSGLMAGALWVMLGFPAWSRAMLARQIARENLLSDPEILYIEREGAFSRMYLRCGACFLEAPVYRQGLLWQTAGGAQMYVPTEGILCLPAGGEDRLLVLGDTGDAVRMEVEIRVDGDLDGTVDGVYTAAGEAVSPGVFSLPVEPVGAPASTGTFRNRWPRQLSYTLTAYGQNGDALWEIQLERSGLEETV